MQFLLMFIGLVQGWVFGVSFRDALIGASIGLGAGQAIVLARLNARAAEQRRHLELAQVALNAVQQRLALLEVSGVKASETSDPIVSEPVAPPEFTLDEIPAAEPELIWDLPPELEPITVAATETSPPLPADIWKPEPVAREPARPQPHRSRHRSRHRRRLRLAVRR
ncbi:hypothetical protein PS880_05428 [Pseudomonas fluorescens]|uniref:DUF2339 domain-containing protein n=1 Tax=Pseudomonas fluorescens TaxID=294 RepID=A0A5E7PS06_PSEFL|nr:hypothetical protein PS880_05428 [Pseudomonas fluorescens]